MHSLPQLYHPYIKSTISKAQTMVEESALESAMKYPIQGFHYSATNTSGETCSLN